MTRTGKMISHPAVEVLPSWAEGFLKRHGYDSPAILNRSKRNAASMNFAGPADGPWATMRIVVANCAGLSSHSIRTKRSREKDAIHMRPARRGKLPEYNCRELELAFPEKAHGLVKRILQLQA
jgi:hypothetical protein